MHIILKILQGSVPERIVGQPDHLELLSPLHKLVKPLPIECVIAAVIQMQHDRQIRIHASHRPDPRVQKPRDIVVLRHFSVRPEQAV